MKFSHVVSSLQLVLVSSGSRFSRYTEGDAVRGRYKEVMRHALMVDVPYARVVLKCVQAMAKKAKKKQDSSDAADAVAASPRVVKVMAGFSKARLSDVSSKLFVATSPVHGKGLFAAKRIKADTVLGRLHGMPTFDDGIYVLWITDELGLELTNDLKYINHDKDPNAAYSDLDVTALRDIEPGEELICMIMAGKLAWLASWFGEPCQEPVRE